MTAAQLLSPWLARRLDADAGAWLNATLEALRNSADDTQLYLAIGLVTRRIGSGPLQPSAAELQQAAALRPHWDPSDWCVDQAARILLLLTLDNRPQRLAHCLEQLCITADLRELVTFYSALPLYPEAHRYQARAAEGLRSNMRPVFAALAHRNPYPAEQLSETAWNQLVLKALFMDLPLWPIVGLDRRANANLARMLCDYAHERWSAGRAVSPELWRCVGPFASGTQLQDLQRVLDQGTPAERRAAALALQQAADPAARVLLQAHGDLQRELAAGQLSWEQLAAAG